MSMKALVIGSGGREHALCWKLAQSPLISKIYCAPGNAGTAAIAENVPIAAEKIQELADFAAGKSIDLTIPGPEAPLCAGISDVFRERGLAVFGPGRAAARLEGSKSFAKDFMRRHNIPTAKSALFNNAAAALEYVRKETNENGIVIKADGLAAGKGVIVAKTLEEAEEAVNRCFSGEFGAAGAKVLIEETLIGEEVSILAIVDGECIRELVPSQDHKRVGDNDTGPNTGGMGAYCPAPVADAAALRQIHQLVSLPALHGLQQDGLYYRGILYAGIMMTARGPKVLEFNVRFGDPETQPVLALMDSDLADLALKTVKGNLSEATIAWKPGAACCVVMAAEGYPGAYAKGRVISGIALAEAHGAKVFHSGTIEKNGHALTAGGRVLGVTAVGSDIRLATEKAYAAVAKIHWDGAFFRHDIASRAIRRPAPRHGA